MSTFSPANEDPSSPPPPGGALPGVIRPADPADLPRITDIYNHEVLTGVATFDITPRGEREAEAWFAQFGTERPLLVHVSEDGTVTGFAYYLQYRPKEGYARTMESTIYIAPEFHRRGIGRALLRALIDRARAGGVRNLMAVLAGENLASEMLHRKCGYEFVGHYPEVGFKFDRWVDTRTWQKILD